MTVGCTVVLEIFCVVLVGTGAVVVAVYEKNNPSFHLHVWLVLTDPMRVRS